MKTVKIIIIALTTTLFSSNSFAQTHDHSKMDMSQAKSSSKMEMATTKSETFKVWGNCGMCKARIEKAAKTDGVTKVSWDKETKMIAVTFDTSKVSINSIQKQIAAVGHDTEKYKADDKVYAKLPGCCLYERKNQNSK